MHNDMGEIKPNRKSSRSFNLGKSGQRSFDLEKKSARSFDLHKEEIETIPTPSKPVPQIEKTTQNAQPQKPQGVKPQTSQTQDTQNLPAHAAKQAAQVSPQLNQTSKSENTNYSDTKPLPQTDLYGTNAENGDIHPSNPLRIPIVWIVIAILALVAIAFLLLRGCNGKSDDNQSGTPEIELPTSGAGSQGETDDADTTADQTNPADVSADAVRDDASAAESGPTQSADVKASRSPSVTSQPAKEALAQPTVGAAASPSTPIGAQPASSGANHDVEVEALNVIRGAYGNAPVRYDRLKEKGLDPREIQRRVNQMKRQGVF